MLYTSAHLVFSFTSLTSAILKSLTSVILQELLFASLEITQCYHTRAYLVLYNMSITSVIIHNLTWCMSLIVLDFMSLQTVIFREPS